MVRPCLGLKNNLLLLLRGKSEHISGPFIVKCLELLVTNYVIFVAYRLIFTTAFATSASVSDRLMVLLRGFRLDSALLGAELFALGVLALVARRLRYRVLLGALWAFTCLHVLVLSVNLLFFHERNQHLWEMLLANLAEPREIWVAIAPFIYQHPIAAVGPLLLIGLTIGAARRHGSSLADWRHDPWSSPQALATVTAVLFLSFLATLDAVPGMRHRRTVTEIRFIASKYYMKFPDYVLNQAVVNPLYDLIRYYGPATLAKPRYHLDAQEALRLTQRLLGLQPGNDRYPLVRTVRGEARLGIRNLILIQVEGLGASVLEHRVSDGYLTPYLHELAESGLYFRDVYQSFSYTNGSVFATATGLHHQTYAALKSKKFLPHEMNGHFGTLPRLFGPRGYRHYFFAGFRQQVGDFESFFRNQDYEAFVFDDFVKWLGDSGPRNAHQMVGIFDGLMLQTVANILLGTPGNFTAHIVTATSHSPWVVPESAPKPFKSDKMNAFRYVDQSIRSFIERLRKELPEFDRTLFVIVGDHTSVTFTDNLRERIRVPLIFYSAELSRQRQRWERRQTIRASHADILPTILALFDGDHAYSGMGSNLLGSGPVESGVISSSLYDSLYIKDSFVLRYTMRDSSTQLYAFENGEIVLRDQAAQYPDVVERLTREFLALYETADRLTREKRVFPRDLQSDRRGDESPLRGP